MPGYKCDIVFSQWRRRGQGETRSPPKMCQLVLLLYNPKYVIMFAFVLSIIKGKFFMAHFCGLLMSQHNIYKHLAALISWEPIETGLIFFLFVWFSQEINGIYSQNLSYILNKL